MTTPDLNRIFLFNTLSVRQIIDNYMSMRLLSKPAGMIAYEAKKELSDAFQNAWVPSNAPIYHVLHQAEEDGYMTSVWESKSHSFDSLKQTRPYRLTDAGASHFRNRLPQMVAQYKSVCKCLNIALDFLFPHATAEHAIVSPTCSQPVNTILFTEMNILAFAEKTNHFLFGDLKDSLTERYGDTYFFADTQLNTRLSHMIALNYITFREVDSSDPATPQKNRGRKVYSITTNGYAYFHELRSPASGIYSRIKAVEKGMNSLLQAYISHLDFRPIHRPQLHVV